MDLGFKPYKEAWDLQKELVQARIDNEMPDTLVFVEHPAVITRGRRSEENDVKSDQFPVYDIERGGRVTYHGPGQLIGYPIMNIQRRGLGVKQYMYALEQIIINVLHHYDIEGSRQAGNTGVWVKDKKIASIGVAVKRWVSYHGFALNVHTDLSHFKAIQPCGFTSETMTSMEKILDKKSDMEEVKALTCQYAHALLVANI